VSLHPDHCAICDELADWEVLQNDEDGVERRCRVCGTRIFIPSKKDKEE
jgi:hypothetical protein